MDEVGLGKILQKARQAAGLTQQELCQKANLSYSTLAKIERGAIKSPSVFTIQRIASAVGLSLDMLLGTNEPEVTVPKQRIKFVYFDINGCLVRFFHRAFSMIAEDTGVPSDRIETTFWHFNDAVCRGDMSMEAFNAELAHTVNQQSIDWTAYYLRAVEPVEGMAELLAWTAERFSVGLLSNIMPHTIEAMQDRGLLPRMDFTAVVDSSEVGAIKPEAKIYEIAQGLSGVEPEEIFFIDDSRTNIMAAEKLGWKVMWFDDYQPKESIDRVRQALA